MKELIWPANKIIELNSWIEDDSTSSIGAVSLEIKKAMEMIMQGGQLLISKNESPLIINSVQELKHFISENLINGNYFSDKI